MSPKKKKKRSGSHKKILGKDLCATRPKQEGTNEEEDGETDAPPTQSERDKLMIPDTQMSQTFTQITQNPGDSSEATDNYNIQLLKKRKRKKAAAVNLSDAQEEQVVNWLKDEKHDLLYNKRRRDYKDTAKRERAWMELSSSVGVTVPLLKQWFSTQRTVYGKLSHAKYAQGREKMTERQQWVMHNFAFLKQHIKRQNILRSTLRPAVSQSLPHQPYPSNSATVSRPPDYDSDDPDPGPGQAEDETVKMHDLSAETYSPTPSKVTKNRRTSTPTPSVEPSLLNEVIKRLDKGSKVTEQLVSLLEVIANKRSGPTENQRRAWTDWLYHEAMSMDDTRFGQFQSDTFDLVKRLRKEQADS